MAIPELPLHSDEVDLPRTQSGSPPQHLLVTLLADYCLRRRARLPSAAMVELVGEFGVTPVGARAALSRLARRGVVEQTKEGRRTSYALAPQAATVLARGSRRLVSFATDSENWDGHWTIVAFSLPEDRRDTRHLLRSRLRWQGFAPLYDGVWVSPHASLPEISAILTELNVQDATVLRASEADGMSRALRSPIEAWDLDEIAALYDEFIDRWSPVVEKARTGHLRANEALVARTQMMDTYRRFPGLDPQLPTSLMPPGWPRRRARELFIEAYDGLGPPAEAQVRQIVAKHGPDLTGAVEHHTTRHLLEGVSADVQPMA